MITVDLITNTLALIDEIYLHKHCADHYTHNTMQLQLHTTVLSQCSSIKKKASSISFEVFIVHFFPQREMSLCFLWDFAFI